MTKKLAWLLPLVPLAACGEPAPGPTETGQTANVAASAAPKRPTPVDTVAPAASKADDGRSVEAARTLIQRYYALLNARKVEEAKMLWGSGRAPDIEANLAEAGDFEVALGSSETPEGAAGSIYIEVPATVTGHWEGRPFNQKRKIVLRRVNDVDGSTEAQRRWHIDSIRDAEGDGGEVRSY